MKWLLLILLALPAFAQVTITGGGSTVITGGGSLVIRGPVSDTNVFGLSGSEGQFVLNTEAKTSALVYSGDTQVRTLWSGVTYPAGTNSYSWDGRDDFGNLMADGTYTVKMLAHNITPTWENVVGNSSSISPTAMVHRAYLPVTDIAGSTNVYLAHGYNELGPVFRGFTNSTPSAPWVFLEADYQTAFVGAAVDTNKVYMLSQSNGFNGNANFVTAFTNQLGVDNVQHFQFSGGDNFSGDRTWTNVAARSNSVIYTAIAVQRTNNSLFIGTSGGKVVTVNKTTGVRVLEWSVTNPVSSLDCDTNGNVWVVSGTNITGWTNITTSPSLIAGWSTMQPVKVRVCPVDNEIVVMDSGTNHQLIAFNTSGVEQWRLGAAGGRDVQGPQIVSNVFKFKSGYSASGALAIETNGTIWIFDPSCSRLVAYSHNRATNTANASFLPTGYIVTADQNAPHRVFWGMLEFNVNYSLPLTNGGWTLTNDWSAGLSTNYFTGNDPQGLHMVSTLNNGRTYAFIKSSNDTFNRVIEIYSNNVVARDTGIDFDENGFTLQKDGSLHDLIANSTNFVVQRRALTGFDGSNNPQWSAATNIINFTKNFRDPYTEPNIARTTIKEEYFPLLSTNQWAVLSGRWGHTWAGTTQAIWTNGIITVSNALFDTNSVMYGIRFTNRVGVFAITNFLSATQVQARLSDVGVSTNEQTSYTNFALLLRPKYQFGLTDGTKFTARGFNSGRLYVDGRIPYTGNVGTAYTSTNIFDTDDEGVNYRAGNLLALSNWVVMQQIGEFTQFGQIGRRTVYYGPFYVADYGAPLLQVSGQDIRYAFPERSGNVFAGHLVANGTNIYSYEDDESHRAGIHRWRIGGSLAETNWPTVRATNVNFAVDFAVEKQPIDGVGGALPGFSYYLYFMDTVPRQRLMDVIFSPTNGIGLSMIRTEMRGDNHEASQYTNPPAPWAHTHQPTNGGSYIYTNDVDNVWVMQTARDRYGITNFLATVWTPPVYMKSNGIYTAQGDAYLIATQYQAYADYLKAYVTGYTTVHGLTNVAVSIANEPDYASFYQGCLWTSEMMTNFLGTYLRPTFSNASIATRVFAPEESSWLGSRGTAILGNANSRAAIYGIADHNYGTPSNSTNATARAYGKRVWMTEHSDLADAGIGDTNMLYWARQIHEMYANAEVNAWFWWWCAVLGESSQAFGYITSSNMWGIMPRGHALGNYARFIRPGMVRVGGSTNLPANVYASSYKDTNTGQLIVVLINSNATATSVTGLVANVTVTNFTPWVTTLTNHLERFPLVSVVSGVYTTALPAMSVVTLQRFTTTNTIPVSNTVYLSDVEWESECNGQWMRPITRDVAGWSQNYPTSAEVLQQQGTNYSKGLGVYASTAYPYSRVTYQLGGNFTNFSAIGGIDWRTGYDDPITFTVYGDGVQLYSSNSTGQTTPVTISVNVTGVRKLVLETKKDGTAGVLSRGHWINARVLAP